MERVISAKPLDVFKVEVEFSDGTHGVISLRDRLFGPVFEPLKDPDYYSNFLNSSTVSPASLTIPPMVKALIGLFRGIVRNLMPSDITICFFPERSIRKPAFSKAFTARRWLTLTRIFHEFEKFMSKASEVLP
jgi:hypothetical protein